MLIHVVSHTHWDREWYHPAERFRQRLVDLIDELLDDDSSKGSFLLDGQTVVLEDYLDVRPERAAELGAALRDGRLEAGPWFVLADELIPSGEGLVRNLLAGARTLRALRAESPPVLYCPDSFGHPAALPLIAQGFDKPVVIVWRGRKGDADAFHWKSGPASVIAYHLSTSGYELGANLPSEAGKASERYASIRRQLAPRAVTGAALLLNGADHHARQMRLTESIAALAAAASPDEVRATTLAAFARDLVARSKTADLGSAAGELRDSYGYTWTLQGTLGSRAHQKRHYAMVERELLRDVEPWAAIATMRGGRSTRHLSRMAWRSLLLCQPHDSLCGCSIDDVARAVDARLAAAATQAVGVRESALDALLAHDRDAARGSSGWTPLLVVRNRAARVRGGVAEVQLVEKLADVPVGPGSRHVKPRAARGAPLAGGLPVQVLDVETTVERTEAPRAYPDNDAVRRTRALVWVDDVPAYGVLPLPLRAPRKKSRVTHAVKVTGKRISNGLVTLRWDARGAFTLGEPQRGTRSLIGWESNVDVGDLYTPAIRAKKLVPRLVGTRVVHRGPLRATVEQSWQFKRGRESVDLRLRLSLDSGAPFLRVAVAGMNAARNHRLRIALRRWQSLARFVADAAFGTTERSWPLPEPQEKAEAFVRTEPLHRYVTLFGEAQGMTVFSDGLAECEMLSDGFAITLVRSVGQLSRSDIKERPGHAGWPADTPDAQCLGPFAAEFALMLHGPHSHAAVDAIERTADDVLLPLAGTTLRSALIVPGAVRGITLSGTGLAFSTAKESEDGAWSVLRCVNLLDRQVDGRWQVPKPIVEARLARLDETPLGAVSATGDAVAFTAAPNSVVTILVR